MGDGSVSLRFMVGGEGECGMREPRRCRACGGKAAALTARVGRVAVADVAVTVPLMVAALEVACAAAVEMLVDPRRSKAGEEADGSRLVSTPLVLGILSPLDEMAVVAALAAKRCCPRGGTIGSEARRARKLGAGAVCARVRLATAVREDDSVVGGAAVAVSTVESVGISGATGESVT